MVVVTMVEVYYPWFEKYVPKVDPNRIDVDKLINAAVRFGGVLNAATFSIEVRTNKIIARSTYGMLVIDRRNPNTVEKAFIKYIITGKKTKEIENYNLDNFHGIEINEHTNFYGSTRSFAPMVLKTAKRKYVLLPSHESWYEHIRVYGKHGEGRITWSGDDVTVTIGKTTIKITKIKKKEALIDMLFDVIKSEDEEMLKRTVFPGVKSPNNLSDAFDEKGNVTLNLDNKIVSIRVDYKEDGVYYYGIPFKEGIYRVKVPYGAESGLEKMSVKELPDSFEARRLTKKIYRVVPVIDEHGELEIAGIIHEDEVLITYFAGDWRITISVEGSIESPTNNITIEGSSYKFTVHPKDVLPLKDKSLKNYIAYCYLVSK